MMVVWWNVNIDTVGNCERIGKHPAVGVLFSLCVSPFGGRLLILSFYH
jgi:hypothetical protein